MRAKNVLDFQTQNALNVLVLNFYIYQNVKLPVLQHIMNTKGEIYIDLHSRLYVSGLDRECQPCDDACLTCTGPNYNECDSCKDTFVFNDNIECINECPTDKYPDSSKIC